MRLDERVGWRGLALLAVVALAACGGGAERDGEEGDHSPTGASAPVATTPQPSPTATPTSGTPAPAPTPTPAAVAVAFNQDIRPILETDCLRCHGQFGSYAGTMAYVVKGSASSPLVRATQSGGSMYSRLSGDRAGKSALIRSWVVENGAAESR
jgi:hypothetical protein